MTYANPNRAPSGRSQSQQPSAIDNVIAEIRKLGSMSALQPQTFAEEGGYADKVAQDSKDKLKPTQLRKVFTEVKQIRRKLERECRTEADWSQPFDRTDLLRLMPVLAYSQARGLLPKEVYELFKLIFSKEKLKTNRDFERTADFLEAVLAYHKYHNPKA
ncbi:MAG: type III-A CRISPR-associated protein Csm2 [Anaerolineae bacterium]|nr:type III-A CRISPR-associated protein Csm2 [Anaerolineae bacterium]